MIVTKVTISTNLKHFQPLNERHIKGQNPFEVIVSKIQELYHSTDLSSNQDEPTQALLTLNQELTLRVNLKPKTHFEVTISPQMKWVFHQKWNLKKDSTILDHQAKFKCHLLGKKPVRLVCEIVIDLNFFILPRMIEGPLAFTVTPETVSSVKFAKFLSQTPVSFLRLLMQVKDLREATSSEGK
ncbi:hypothetical protein RJ641_018459 [Dillenia turbinata]|uniref:Uncharacterized protein n=1 Tax=Dillenia turbinata TaxID=194707 RepID=A0AAN8UJ29_9MAGN